MKRNITTIVLSMISLIIFSSCNIYGIVIPKDSTNMNRMIIGIWEGTLKVSVYPFYFSTDRIYLVYLYITRDKSGHFYFKKIETSMSSKFFKPAFCF